VSSHCSFVAGRHSVVSLYSDSLQAGRSGDRIPVGGESFRVCPDRPWSPTNLLCYGLNVSFLGVKRPGRHIDNPAPSKIKERVELYLYSPSEPLCLCRAILISLYIYTECPRRNVPDFGRMFLK